MFSKILVPTDGSKLSQKAVQQALLLAQMTGAHLVALHVYPKFVSTPFGTDELAEQVLADIHVTQHEAGAGKIFATINDLAKAAGVALDTMLVQSDDIYKQIIAVAKQTKCDLIRMASHGRRGVAGILLGSETQKVLTHSKIAVLVVR